MNCSYHKPNVFSTKSLTFCHPFTEPGYYHPQWPCAHPGDQHQGTLRKEENTDFFWFQICIVLDFYLTIDRTSNKSMHCVWAVFPCIMRLVSPCAFMICGLSALWTRPGLVMSIFAPLTKVDLWIWICPDRGTDKTDKYITDSNESILHTLYERNGRPQNFWDIQLCGVKLHVILVNAFYKSCPFFKIFLSCQKQVSFIQCWWMTSCYDRVLCKAGLK